MTVTPPQQHLFALIGVSCSRPESSRPASYRWKASSPPGLEMNISTIRPSPVWTAPGSYGKKSQLSEREPLPAARLCEKTPPGSFSSAQRSVDPSPAKTRGSPLQLQGATFWYTGEEHEGGRGVPCSREWSTAGPDCRET